MALFLTSFLHGEELAFIWLAVLLVLLILLSLAGLLSWWFIRQFRVRFGKKVYLFPVGILLLLASLIYLPFWLVRPSSGPPSEISAGNIQRIADSLPNYARFGFSGLAYFDGKLYVSTNIGLLEFENGQLLRLLQFQRTDSVISGPWVDPANHMLWIKDEHVGGFVRFDGKTWTRLPMPTPQKGYYTRGDALESFQIIPDATSTTFVSAGTGWKWDPHRHDWEPLLSPPQEMSMQLESTLIGMLPMDKNFFLMRHESFPYLFHGDEKFQSDTISYMANSWTEISGSAEFPFFANTWIVAHGVGYICSRSEQLLRVTTSTVSPIESPGKCEALATTDAGNLLVSFRGKGIFEYTNQWELRAAPPYQEGSGEYWAHLASHGDEIAYAIEAQPIIDKQKSVDQDIKWTVNAPTKLWIIKNGQAREALLTKR